jgi:hypothetical protein
VDIAILGIDLSKTTFHIIGLNTRGEIGRVEDWRHGSVGLAYQFLPVSSGSASLAKP